jgi:hypothetical protein
LTKACFDRGGTAVDESFKNALRAYDLDAIRRCPKSDLHNHSMGGGNPAYIHARTGIKVDVLDHKLTSMAEMHAWADQRIGRHFAGPMGRLELIEATFAQAASDGLSRLETGEDIWAITLFDDSAAKLTDLLKQLHARAASSVEWIPQISMSRHCRIENLDRWLMPFLDLGFYRTLDLSGDEFAQPIENFKPLYRKATLRGLRLKAHVGEWGDADSVWRAVEELGLDEVQHGIAAAESPMVMRFLADHGVRLNICPTSNHARARRVADGASNSETL